MITTIDFLYPYVDCFLGSAVKEDICCIPSYKSGDIYHYIFIYHGFLYRLESDPVSCTFFRYDFERKCFEQIGFKRFAF